MAAHPQARPYVPAPDKTWTDMEAELARAGRRATRLERRLEAFTGPSGRCVYCGTVTTGIVCYGHIDLPGLDPHYRGLG